MYSINYNSSQLRLKCFIFSSCCSFHIAEKIVRNYQACDKTEILEISFTSSLPLGIGYLNIKFEGCLNDRMYGFYRTKNTFVGDTCSDEYAAVTHFEVCCFIFMSYVIYHSFRCTTMNEAT